MSKIKSFLLPVLFFFIWRVNFAASFTYSGPTSATIPFGQTSASATYYFSYSGMDQLWLPSIGIVVDGNTILAPKSCSSEAYLPSSYTITFNSVGSHTVYFILTQLADNGTPCGTRKKVMDYPTFNVNVKFQISVENIFTGGSINVDNSFRTSPFHRTAVGGNNVPIGAIEQDYGGYHWIWNTNGTYNSEWDRIPSGIGASEYSYSQNTTYTVQSSDMNTRVVAGLRKICNITFQNNFVGLGNGSNIAVSGTQYNSPASGFTVIEQNPITASASSHNINGIVYYFDHWSDGSTSDTKTFYPNDNTTYTAYFTGIPSKVNFNFGFDQVVGQPIKMHWTDNVNPNITYQIWRTYKGDQIGPIKIATVQKGVQTYTDYAYTFTGGYTDKLLYYDVREYYSVEDTTSPVSWHAVYGTGKSLKISVPKDTLSKKVIKNYSLACYPNPFNPSTTINYQLPKDGFVSLKIFDIVGNEVKTLVNGYRSAGSYNVTFNASTLPSGIYFYRIKTNDYFKVKKMLMIK